MLYSAILLVYATLISLVLLLWLIDFHVDLLYPSIRYDLNIPTATLSIQRVKNFVSTSRHDRKCTLRFDALGKA